MNRLQWAIQNISPHFLEIPECIENVVLTGFEFLGKDNTDVLNELEVAMHTSGVTCADFQNH